MNSINHIKSIILELYEKKLKGENIEQDIAVTSLTSKTLGTFYFPQKVDSEDSQSASVSLILLEILCEILSRNK